MNWIKVTPETMPSKGERVILTTINQDGSKTTDVATWFGEENGWKILLLGYHSCTLADGGYSFTITHWMPYPKPAED